MITTVLICATSGRRVYLSRADLDRSERFETARRLLASGMSRSDATVALRTRYGVSRWTAWRWVSRVAQ
jgi:hypothetical protein